MVAAAADRSSLGVAGLRRAASRSGCSATSSFRAGWHSRTNRTRRIATVGNDCAAALRRGPSLPTLPFRAGPRLAARLCWPRVLDSHPRTSRGQSNSDTLLWAFAASPFPSLTGRSWRQDLVLQGRAAARRTWMVPVDGLRDSHIQCCSRVPRHHSAVRQRVPR